MHIIDIQVEVKSPAAVPKLFIHVSLQISMQICMHISTRLEIEVLQHQRVEQNIVSRIACADEDDRNRSCHGYRTVLRRVRSGKAS